MKTILMDFWIQGLMPLQLFFVMAFVFFTFVIGQHILKRFGLGVRALGQAILIWLAGYGIFKFVVFPPLPASLLYTYMVLITIVVYFFISSTEQSWKSFQKPILSTIRGETPFYKRARMTVFIVLPLLAAWGTYDYIKPVLPERPLEFRSYHPRSPRSIMLQKEGIVLPPARKPSRNDGAPVYNQKKADSVVSEN